MSVTLFGTPATADCSSASPPKSQKGRKSRTDWAGKQQSLEGHASRAGYLVKWESACFRLASIGIVPGTLACPARSA